MEVLLKPASTLLYVIEVMVAFGLLVTVHEFGHFILAKASGMRVDEFAIGFGKALFSFRRGETLYSIRIIPLGGYNRIYGMEIDEETAEEALDLITVDYEELPAVFEAEEAMKPDAPKIHETEQNISSRFQYGRGDKGGKS